MKKSDALSILDLTDEVTEADVKKAYLAAVKKYHPDVNPAGEEMMKLVNAAFEALKGFEGDCEDAGEAQADYGVALNKALNAIIAIADLEIEICGAWIWVGGETFAYKDVLRGAGFKWAKAKRKWHFRPANWKSRSRGGVSMEDIRGRYGSVRPSRPQRDELEGNAA